MYHSRDPAHPTRLFGQAALLLPSGELLIDVQLEARSTSQGQKT